MHVLYVIDSLVPGGSERSLVALAPAFSARGIALDVAYLHDRKGLQDDLVQAGASLFCLAGRGGRIGWIQRATRLVTDRKPDIVHTTLFEADVAGRIAGRIAGRPVVSSLVNVAYGSNMLLDPNLRRWKVRGAQLADAATARFVRRFHAVTSHVADVMSNRLRVPRSRIDVVPRGRDPSTMGLRTPARTTSVREGLGIDAQTSLLLALARHERQKGLDVLLEALSDVVTHQPGVRLLIAGRGGSQTPSLQRTVDRLGLGDAVRFLGARSDVPDLLCAADLFIFPSRWEGFAGAVLEAMALEAPIVASDLAGIRELVDDDCAWLVRPDRPDDLAAAVMEALTDPDESARRAALAAERFRAHLTIDAVADRMLAFYHRSLAD